MTRERDDRSLKEKAREQITRVLDAWPAHRASDTWRDELTRGMTAAADDPADITRAVTKLIREHEDRYPPQIATFVQTVARQREARLADNVIPLPNRRTTRSIDEEALVDAIAALDYATTHEEREEIEGQIASIRRRLPKGTPEPRGIRFLAGAPDYRDPPGTLRFVVVHPDGTRNPRNARLAGE